ncbi:ribokinase [Mycolicibacterium frederiksbergense]|nr:ribokinase [Mycolicibacterium frederiksbergense]
MNNPPNPTITCVGSTMVDLSTYLLRMPDQGETVFGRGFSQGFGGKGASQAVIAALLGARVAMVNTVATDSFGRDTITNFEQFGIDVSMMRQVDGTYSGVANILVSPDGNNRIVLGAGANEQVTVDQVNDAFQTLPPPDVVISQLEIPQPAILAAFQGGRAARAVNILNPGPAAAIDPAILEATDYLIPNETEFELLYAEVFGHECGRYEDAIIEFAQEIKTNSVITLGAQGALLFELGQEAPRKFSAPMVAAVDTTGAGDAFCGSFAYAIAAGHSAAAAIKLAIGVASDSVTRPGTQLSFPRGEKLQTIAAAALEA